MIRTFSHSLLLSLFLMAFPSSVFASTVVINELLPNPISGEDWVELYNVGIESIDLNGWYLRDEATTHIKDFSSSTVVAPGAFLAVDVGTRLNKEKDTVMLYNNTDTSLDSQLYTANPGDGVSVGRYPDGSSTWVSLQNPTKESSNRGPLPSSTPTPTNVPTPTKTPSPTKTPTPPRTPTPDVIPTNTPSASSSMVSGAAPAKKPTPAILGEETSEPDPTINLDIVDATNQEGTPSGAVTETPSEKEPGKKGTIFPFILIVVGGILTFGFGVPLVLQELQARRKKMQ